MGEYLPELVLVVALILVNSILAGTEVALISLREGQLHRLERQGGAAARTARLARRPGRFLATVQVGITLAGFLASAVAAIGLAEPLQGVLGFFGSWARPVAVVAVTMVLSYATLVLGELAPKRLAMQRAERWARVMSLPLDFLALITRPAVWVLERSTDLVVRLLGGDPARRGEEITEEEVRDLIAGHRFFTPEQRTVVMGALEVGERSLREVVRPRRSVQVLDAGWPCSVGAEALLASGHTRAPVADDADLDQATGVVHLRDLVGDVEGRIRDRARPATYLPETVRVLDAVRRLQADRQQMAIVINEHGGAEGIVTVEDLVEEIVGEIYDETDRDVVAARPQPDGSWLVVGTFPIHDLIDLGIDAPTGEYTTVAGLVLDRLGAIPERAGVAIELPGWRVEVVSVEDRTIREVRFRPVVSSPDSG